MPTLGTKSIVGVQRSDIAELLDHLQNEKKLKAQVNRVRSQLVLMFNWGVERAYLDHSPAQTVKKRRIEKPGERVLIHDELRAIWRAAEGLRDPARSLVKTWILSGMRRDEARCGPIGEVALKRAVWTVPAARHKSGHDFELPLSTQMVELLEPLVKKGKYLFSIGGDKPYAGQRRLKEILDRESGVTDWVIHDLRRTVRTGLSEIGVLEEIAKMAIGHAKKGLVRTYNLHAYASEKRVALQAWADHVALIVNEK